MPNKPNLPARNVLLASGQSLQQAIDLGVIGGSVFHKAKTYAAEGALEADINCLADSPTGLTPALRIRVGLGGTVVLVFQNDAEAIVTYASGDVDDIEIKAIRQTSSAQQITLYWL